MMTEYCRGSLTGVTKWEHNMARQVQLVDGRDVAAIKTAAASGSFSKVVRDFTQAMTLRAQATQISSRANKLKESLKDYVSISGKVDSDKGHMTVEFPEPILVDGVTFTGMTNQRRQTVFLNEDTAKEILTERGVLKDAVETVEQLVQDKIFALYQEEKLSDDDMAAMFETTVTWAFVPVKK